MNEIFRNRKSAGFAGLPVAGSRWLDADTIAWQECGEDGFWIKPLLEDEAAGLRTWLMKVDPGAFSAPHAHDEFEQVYVLDGTFYDDQRSYRAGEFVVRAPGAMHSAGSEDGALVLLFYSPAE